VLSLGDAAEMLEAIEHRREESDAASNGTGLTALAHDDTVDDGGLKAAKSVVRRDCFGLKLAYPRAGLRG